MGGKNKKKQKRELSQAEIWDDSALVQSWEDALAEYKKYHSIYAHGEQVEDVIRAFESAGEEADMAEDAVSGPKADFLRDGVNGIGPDELEDELEDGELEEGEAEESSDPMTNGLGGDFSQEQTFEQTVPSQHAPIPGVPAAMADGVKDEALKNLMMSWYYAGYYTGFYEGQRSTVSSASK